MTGNNWKDKVITYGVRYPLAFIASVILITLFAVYATSNLGRRLNLGGILGTLWGSKEKPKSRAVLANEIPENRKDDTGSFIQIGEADEDGYVQREVKVLQPSKNILRDKSVLTIYTKKGVRNISLPKGVIDVDVDKVFEITPELYSVEVKKEPTFSIQPSDISKLRG